MALASLAVFKLLTATSYSSLACTILSFAALIISVGLNVDLADVLAAPEGNALPGSDGDALPGSDGDVIPG